jgi:hypothetical protein
MEHRMAAGSVTMFSDRLADAPDYDADPEDLKGEAAKHVNWWITSFRGQNKDATDFALAMIDQFEHYGLPHPEHWYFLELWQKELLSVPEENFRERVVTTGPDGADFPYMATPADVGRPCAWIRFTSNNLSGTVRYVGPHHDGLRLVIGIELDAQAPPSNRAGNGLVNGLNQYYVPDDPGCSFYENTVLPGTFVVVPSHKVQLFAADDDLPIKQCIADGCKAGGTGFSYCDKHVHYHHNMVAVSGVYRIGGHRPQI